MDDDSLKKKEKEKEKKTHNSGYSAATKDWQLPFKLCRKRRRILCMTTHPKKIYRKYFVSAYLPTSGVRSTEYGVGNTQIRIRGDHGTIPTTPSHGRRISNRCECQEEALQLRQQGRLSYGPVYGVKLFSISRTHFSTVSFDWTLKRSPLLIWGLPRGVFIPWLTSLKALWE
jgi:hypothetical protein